LRIPAIFDLSLLVRPVNYFDPRGLIASNFVNGANENPNSPENEAYAENSLATDASLPPSFYRGLANFANHTLQGLINLPGAAFQVGSSSLTFSGTVVVRPMPLTGYDWPSSFLLSRCSIPPKD